MESTIAVRQGMALCGRAIFLALSIQNLNLFIFRLFDDY